MRSEYAATLRSAYRTQASKSWWAFVLAAQSINDGFRRIQYLRQYQAYRRRQSRLIAATKKSLEAQTATLAARRQEKEQLLLAAQDQGLQLSQALEGQSKLVEELTGAERKLLVQVKKQQSEHETLNQAVEQAIAAEMSTRRQKERATLAAATSPAANSAKAGTLSRPAAASGFGSQRGRLPWPASGKITKPFGKQPHPEVPSVIIYNGGIDIQAGAAARIQAVYGGEVISSRYVPGYRHTVMLRHGEYYTVYSNLDRVAVKVGDKLDSGAAVGYTSSNGEALHFELWNGQTRQDPSRWLQ
ncbi:MAG: peptidoglycan DD-metalloendopeptidase family protein [Lewinella sp.]|nr:peptidoglycan DD-metalloendopeptidase family protein [Lewinella sp.]